MKNEKYNGKAKQQHMNISLNYWKEFQYLYY